MSTLMRRIVVIEVEQIMYMTFSEVRDRYVYDTVLLCYTEKWDALYDTAGYIYKRVGPIC